MTKRSAIAVACAAILVVAVLLPLRLSGIPQPESALPSQAVLEAGDASAVPAASNAEDAVPDGEAAPASAQSGDSPLLEPEYAPDVVLVEIADTMTLEEVNEQLATLDYIATDALSEDDLVFGYAELALAEWVTVEDALQLLRFEDFTSAVQPNYVYHLLDDYDSAADASDSAQASEAVTSGSLQAGASSAITAQTTSVNDTYSKVEASDNNKWMLTAINAYAAWDYARANHQVTVAVLDSGLNVDHEDLRDNVVGAWSVVNESGDVTDSNGHGTHVAGIIGATANNEKGVAGVSYNANIMPVQVIKPDGKVDTLQAVKGVQYVLDHRNDNGWNVRVVNMSFGGPYSEDVQASKEKGAGPDALFLAAMEDLHDADILVVCAAGNYADRKGHVSDGEAIAEAAYKCFPCDYDSKALGVINLTHNGTTYMRATGSNFNMLGQTTKNISAPGTSINSTVKGGGYGYMSGTSMASPCVAGVAALVFAAAPDLSAEDVKSTLQNTATDLYTKGFDLQSGYGMVNAEAALKAVAPNAAPLISGDSILEVGGSAQLSISNSSSEWRWSSSDSEIATVSGGAVTGVSAGSAIITANADNIFITQAVNVYDPTISGKSVVPVGTATELSVSSANPSGTWRWSTSDSSIVQILDSKAGSIYGRALGTATVTVSLESDPSISSTLEVTVGSSDLSNATVSGISDQVFTGSAITFPNLKVRMYSSVGNVTGYTELKEGEDYQIIYSDNTDVGVAIVTIEGDGGYSGRLVQTFRITEYSLLDAETASINASSATYTGYPIEPGVTIVVDGVTLDESTDGGVTGDYMVDYENNINHGTARVTVTGINNYSGTMSGNFAINAVSITSEDVTVSGVVDKTFTGSDIAQSPILTYNGKRLAEGEDYQVEYSDNVDAGTARMRIQGLNNFATNETVFYFLTRPVYRYESFTINPAPISGAEVSFPGLTYNGAAQRPDPTVTFNGIPLTAGVDYTVAYPGDCANAGTKDVTIAALAGGNFTGSCSASYSIAKRSLTITANSQSKVYDGSALTGASAGYTASGLVDADASSLSVSLSGSVTNAGSVKSVVSSYSLSGGKAANYSVTTKDGVLTVAQAPLSSAVVTLSQTSYTYDGKAKTPDVTVKAGSRTLTSGADYTVSYSNNVNMGTATATVTGRGNYTGTASQPFTIAAARQQMHRLYNPNSGEHFYTASTAERDDVVKAGWTYEGIGWIAPATSSTPVYRLYNANGGEHHYTPDKAERDNLVNVGWKDEGIGWYSDDAKAVPLYRDYNPNAFANNHNYTTSKEEHEWLLSLGWKDEGYAWYGVK